MSFVIEFYTMGCFMEHLYLDSWKNYYLICILQLAKSYGMDFFETSARTNYHIKEVSLGSSALMSWCLVFFWLASIQQILFYCNLTNIRLLLLFVLCHSQSFTRLTELALQADGKDLDSYLLSNKDDLAVIDPDEEEAEEDVYTTCSC